MWAQWFKVNVSLGRRLQMKIKADIRNRLMVKPGESGANKMHPLSLSLSLSVCHWVRRVWGLLCRPSEGFLLKKKKKKMHRNIILRQNAFNAGYICFCDHGAAQVSVQVTSGSCQSSVSPRCKKYPPHLRNFCEKQINQLECVKEQTKIAPERKSSSMFILLQNQLVKGDFFFFFHSHVKFKA